MKIPFYFDAARICIGDFCIARNTGLKAFVYLLQAVGLPCTTPEEGTVCVDNATLFHNLHGKCHFRFSETESGNRVFSKVKFVIDPDLYPGLKDAPRAKRMQALRDFVAVALGDRLDALAAGDGAQEARFRRVDDQIYESALVRVKQELDHYHAVITVSYRERKNEENGTMPVPETGLLLKRIDELEARVAAVEKENRELRKVNDVVLELFGGLKPAHDLRTALIPENEPKEEDHPDGMSPARRSALINRYAK
ncbi:MAG: hypothetical protein K6G16_03635 [Lachnospiraceae bacterium]|nr:hypothetical protein [Lachnospiraceae bacterium]